MEFKHVDDCWYFEKLNHQDKPYGWPCSGEISECDSEYVESLKKENNRMRAALERLASDPNGLCCDCPDIREHARSALKGDE